MTNRELAAALRLCGSTPGFAECRARCPFFRGPDADLCVPWMTAACADALANSETHIAALQREIEKLRAQLEMAQKPQWTSVEERLPEPLEPVLTFSEAMGHRVLRREKTKHDWILDVNSWHHFLIPESSVTHWMPLPSTEGVE